MQVIKHSIIEFKTQQKYLKQLKQLSRRMTGEQLKLLDSGDIVTVLHNDKIIGMCCITMKSPGGHFNNEDDANIPYLYNYICDISHKKKKPSVFIMNFLKDSLKNYPFINLDVEIENDHAKQFFERNGFVYQGDYGNNIKEYKMYTFTFDKHSDSEELVEK
ncbi:MAG: GNAT family N-acetyltransferase [Cetobacterium sp.]